MAFFLLILQTGPSGDELCVWINLLSVVGAGIQKEGGGEGVSMLVHKFTCQSPSLWVSELQNPLDILHGDAGRRAVSFWVCLGLH